MDIDTFFFGGVKHQLSDLGTKATERPRTTFRIPLQPPTSSSLRRGDFYLLFELLLSEELYFEKLPETALGQVSQHHDMLCHPATFKSHSGRVDLIGRKPVRPVETRSSRLRKRDIKTQPWILDASP